MLEELNRPTAVTRGSFLLRTTARHGAVGILVHTILIAHWSGWEIQLTALGSSLFFPFLRYHKIALGSGL